MIWASTSKLFSCSIFVVVVAWGESEESADADTDVMTSKENNGGKEGDEDDKDSGGQCRKIVEVRGEGRSSLEAEAGRQERQ